MAGGLSQDVQDRAREWVNEHYPNAEGAEWDGYFDEACRELVSIDAHNDRIDRASSMAGLTAAVLDGVGRHLSVGNNVKGWNADGSTRTGVVESLAPPRQATVRWSDGKTEEVDAKTIVNVSIGAMSTGGAQTMAKDCQGADLAIGDRVSIDKVGEGTVSSVAGDSVRIRVPGATPDEESFNAREIEFWRVRKLSRATSLARTSGYVYELESGANWQSAPDDAWDTVVAAVDGSVVGRRRIDGSTMVVIEQGGKYYAVLPQNVTMSRATTLDRRRVDLGFGHTYLNDDRPVPEHGSLIAESEDGGFVEYWDYPGRGEWAYQGKRVTVHARGRDRGTAMAKDKFGNPIFHPGERLRWRGEVFEVVEGNTPEGSVQIKDSTGKTRWLGLGEDVKKLSDGSENATRFGRDDDDLLDEWLDEWVLLTTGQVGLVQTVRGGQLSIDVAAGPLDHIDDAGWHTVLVPPSVVQRKLNWDEIQRLRTPEGWTAGHAPRLSGATDSARTMARVKARFLDDNTAQFKKDQIVYVDDRDLKSEESRIWISEDPEGMRGAYGFPSEVEALSATRVAADVSSRKVPEGVVAGATLATLDGITARVVRRYSVGGQSWLLVVTADGKTVSWPAAEARTMGNATKTRSVAGHSITLRVGVRYRASRPMADRSRKVYPITIEPIDGSEAPSVVIEGLNYDQANALLTEFNNGETSFEGRVWLSSGDSNS